MKAKEFLGKVHEQKARYWLVFWGVKLVILLLGIYFIIAMYRTFY